MLFFVATVTPFDARGRVDLGRLRAHVLWLAAQGVDGFIPTGTTGEFLYLSDREREAVHRTVLDSAGSLAVYPCTWDPSPATTIYLSEAARDAGASGILLPPPVFYDVDEGVIGRWYREVAEKARIPVLAYHNPHYIKSQISPQLYDRLRKDDVLGGMKDSSTDLFRLRRLAATDPGSVFAGGDRILGQARSIPALAGFISAIGNVWPRMCLRIYKNNEAQLEEALIDRVNRVRRGGGLRALKMSLGMGCRMPLPEPTPDQMDGFPDPEWPE